jgi:hypothetical protein
VSLQGVPFCCLAVLSSGGYLFVQPFFSSLSLTSLILFCWLLQLPESSGWKMEILSDLGS